MHKIEFLAEFNTNCRAIDKNLCVIQNMINLN